MAKIAAALDDALTRRAVTGGAGEATPSVIASGDGWTVADVICTSGPQDRRFEERHSSYAIALVVAGSFQYRSARGGGLMTPGSAMLGQPGQCYECGHEHGRGDRCVAFWYAPEFFERIVCDANPRAAHPIGFAQARLPALRELSPLVARAAAGVSGDGRVSWEELALDLAARASALSGRPPGDHRLPPGAAARVTQAVRAIDRQPAATLTLSRLARQAHLSAYHFLRTFQRVTGVTPHQYLLRARLREAARRLTGSGGKIVDVALDCGFGDVSNFNRAFRAEFGVSPRGYRKPR